MYLRSPWQRARMCLEPVDCGVAAEVAALITPGYAGEHIDLERALASLTPTARAVVWMYEVEGYSHQEIAHAVWSLRELFQDRSWRGRTCVYAPG